MFNILIVDDEKIIRDGIAQLVDWNTLGCHLVGIEKNGLKALERIIDKSKTPPDIVITDVRMPFMTGIEMIEKITDMGLNIVFIVLSGYNEFEYAKSVMERGVKYYLLKPTSEDEIIQVIKKACDDAISIRREKEIQEIVNIKQQVQKQYSHTVKQIMKAIDENISKEELSLKWIAENIVYMNEDYLSKSFKKEVGENFSDYLLNKKISLAKEALLSGKEQKIYEVFECLGFDMNTRYFSQVFKKYTGMTPREYRKNHMI